MIQKGDRFGFCMIKSQKARMTKPLTPFFNSKMTSVQMRFVSRLGAAKFCYHYANREVQDGMHWSEPQVKLPFH